MKLTHAKRETSEGKRVYYGLKFAGMCLTGRRHAFFAIDMRQRVCVAFCLPCISKKRVFSFFATVKNRIVQLNSVREFCNEVLTSSPGFPSSKREQNHAITILCLNQFECM